MAEIVHFVLGDFFHFTGAVIIIALIFDGLTSIIVAIRGGQPRSMLVRLGSAVLGGSSATANSTVPDGKD
jgi:hypothetical protein